MNKRMPATKTHKNSAPCLTETGCAPLLAVIPAWNEENTVGEVVRQVKQILGCDVVVVDDTSTDKTAENAGKAGAVVLQLVNQLNAWGAIQAGLRYGLKNGYRTVVTLDADGQHLPETIPMLLEPLIKKQAEVTIGAFPQRGSPARHIAWSFFRTITNLSYDDLTSGLRVYNHRAIKVLASRDATLLDYQDIGILMLLRKSRLRITEVPVTMEQRQIGKSKIFKSWFTVFSYMLQTFILSMAKSKEKRVENDD